MAAGRFEFTEHMTLFGEPRPSVMAAHREKGSLLMYGARLDNPWGNYRDRFGRFIHAAG